MTTIKDLSGFCYPLTPGGVSSLVGDLLWHYATEYLTIAYRADPAAIAAQSFAKIRSCGSLIQRLTLLAGLEVRECAGDFPSPRGIGGAQ
jgi:hypothetical protein